MVRSDTYNSARHEIVERLSAPINKWARMGFLRGFCGMRTEALPAGRMTLPSAAFNDIATRCLLHGAPDEEETEVRKRFILDVDEDLRAAQSSAIKKHFKYAAIGQIFDIIMAISIIAIFIGLVVNVGVFEPLAFMLILLLSISLIALRISANRVVKVAEQAFKVQADDIRLPWTH